MVRVAGYSDYFVNLPKGLQRKLSLELNKENYSVQGLFSTYSGFPSMMDQE